MEDYTFTLITPPKYVGGYRMCKHTSDYTQFNMTYKPIWFHRQMMRIFFGWYWFDNNDVNKIVLTKKDKIVKSN